MATLRDLGRMWKALLGSEGGGGERRVSSVSGGVRNDNPSPLEYEKCGRGATSDDLAL